MSAHASSYYSEIGGDFKGIQGDISGGIINQYIIAEKSGIEIRSQPLITGSPYLGLMTFEADNKDKFFGRDRWILELTNYLEERNILLLLGASGSGKSSLIRAGVIPKLKDKKGYEQLVNLTFAPDENPFESFYACLLSKYEQSRAKQAKTIKEDTLIKVVQSLRDDSQWLIFIDQFEQLFTRTPPKMREIFIKSLIHLIKNSDASVKIILTMRADFLDKFSPYPDFGKIHDRHSRMLTEMDDSELRLAIAEPAARNGVTFDAGLIENFIIPDFYKQVGSLPLLQYTLNLLWKEESLQDRVLKIKTYQYLGGVTSALRQQANNIYKQFKEQEQKAAEQIFLKLIKLVGKEPLSIKADKASFEQDKTQTEVLYTLIKNRLLVSKREEGKATVEVAHEKLLRSWDFLQNLIRDKEDIISLIGRLREDANEWYELSKQKPNEEKAKAKQLLWSRYKLEKFNELIDEEAFKDLHEKSKKFIKASSDWCDRLEREDEERRQRELKQVKKANKNLRWFIGTLIGGLLVASVLAGISIRQWQQVSVEEIKAFTKSAKTYLESNQEFDGLLDGLRASQNMKNTWLLNIFGVDADTRIELKDTLQHAINLVRESNRIEGHENQVWSVSFSPDNELIATASFDKTVKLWNRTGKLYQTLKDSKIDGKTHKNVVKSLSFSSDGQLIVTAGGETDPNVDSTVKLWNRQGNYIPLNVGDKDKNGNTDGVTSVSFSPDDNLIVAVTYQGTAILWEQNGQPYQTLKDPQIGDKAHQKAVKSVSFSSNGQLIATGSDDGSVKLWEKNQNDKYELIQRPLKGHKGEVWSVKFSPDKDSIFLVSGSNDKTVKLWKKQNGEYQDFSNLVEHDGGVICHEKGILSISFSPDGQTLATASLDETVKLWKKQNGEYKYFSTLNAHKGGVLSVSFSPDGQTLATAGDDRTVKLWDLNSPHTKILRTYQDEIYSVSFSPDGETLATGGQNATAKLWDWDEKGQLIDIIPKSKDGEDIHNGAVYVVFSPKDQLIATYSWEDNKRPIHLWKITSTRNTKHIQNINENEKHNKVISDVSFSSDDQFAISSDLGGTVNLWKKREDRLNYTFLNPLESPEYTRQNGDVINKVSFNPIDNHSIATGSQNGTVRLWNQAGKITQTLKEPNDDKAHQSNIRSITFSSDGSLLATASEDETVKIWKKQNDNNKYEYLQTLEGHQDWVWSVRFSPNDSFLATGSGDGTIKIWKKNQAGKYEYFRTLFGHNATVTSISFRPDGTLASASYDERVILWKSYQKTLDELLVDACDWASDYLNNKSQESNEYEELSQFCQQQFKRQS